MMFRRTQDFDLGFVSRTQAPSAPSKVINDDPEILEETKMCSRCYGSIHGYDVADDNDEVEEEFKWQDLPSAKLSTK